MNMQALMIRKVFIQLNELSSSYKGTGRFLKAILLFMCGSAYPPQFENTRRSEIMEPFVTSKVIRKINDDAAFLVCFK